MESRLGNVVEIEEMSKQEFVNTVEFTADDRVIKLTLDARACELRLGLAVFALVNALIQHGATIIDHRQNK